jgi:hypothetical protein
MLIEQFGGKRIRLAMLAPAEKQHSQDDGRGNGSPCDRAKRVDLRDSIWPRTKLCGQAS